MRLFTHQSEGFIKSLLIRGYVENNGNVMRDEDHIRFAYTKLIDYARENVNTEFVGYPIWCWYKIEMASVNNGIKIELEVPDNLVLLSDYYDWGGDVLHYAELFLGGIEYDVAEGLEKSFLNSVNQGMLRTDIQAIIPYIKLDWVKNKAELESIIA